MTAHVSGLFIYPVKSVAGIPMQEAHVRDIGIAHDRRYMIVKPDGTFVTGRTHPKITAIRAQATGETLTLTCEGVEPITITANQFTDRYIDSVVWSSDVNGQECGEAADRWISDLLGEPLKLLFFGEKSHRISRHGSKVSFADGFPLLLIGNASLDHLNGRLPGPVSMANFRPNIAVEGTLPFAEDEWARIRIGEVEFVAPKPCGRCVFTTVDPHAHVADKLTEPLKTLSQYRKADNGEVNFGENLVPVNEGVIRVGDRIEVLETKPRPVYADNWQPEKARLARHLAFEPAKSFDREPVLLRCVQVVEETADVKTFKFTADPFQRFSYQPGQFMTLRLSINGETVSRCYTISSSPSRPDLVSVTVKRVPDGQVSNWMHDHITVGSSVEALGPAGVFHLGQAKGHKLMLLSGGSGITPMLSMARFIADTGLDLNVHFHHSAHTAADLIAWEELTLMAKQLPGLTLSCNLSRASGDAPMGLPVYSGRISAGLLQEVCPDLLEREVFVCGPDGFMASAKDVLLTLGLPEENHHEESFTIDAVEAPVIEEGAQSSYQVSFTNSNITVEVAANQSILSAAEAAGITVDYSCRSGLCGTCKSNLVSGEITAPDAQGVTSAEEEAGKFLPCCSFARSDLEVAL